MRTITSPCLGCLRPLTYEIHHDTGAPEARLEIHAFKGYSGSVCGVGRGLFRRFTSNKDRVTCRACQEGAS